MLHKIFKHPFLVFVLLFSLSILFYFRSLHFYFISDSLLAIDLRWVDVWKEMFQGGNVMGYRPLGVAWFVLNNSIWGDAVLGHRLGALLMHALSAFLVFLITRRVYHQYLFAFIAALIFIATPASVEANVWLAASAGSVISTFFALLSAWVWMKPQKLPSKIRGGVAALFFLLSLFTKEIAIILPLVLLIFDMMLKRISICLSVANFKTILRSYWPFAGAFIIYFSGYYFSGTLNSIAGSPTEGLSSGWLPIMMRFDELAGVLFSPMSAYVEFRTGHIKWLWLCLLLLLPFVSKKTAVPFILMYLSSFPVLFYYGDRMTYFPLVFFSMGIGAFIGSLYLKVHSLQKFSLLKKTAPVILMVLLMLILIVDYRFIQRYLEPWQRTAFLGKNIPEKVYRLLPDPQSGSQIILFNMTYHQNIKYSLWPLFFEVKRYYADDSIEIKQVYAGEDVENLVNIRSIPCNAERKRYFVKYFPVADSVGFVSLSEAGINCP